MVRIYTLTLAPSLDSATITPQIYPEGKLRCTAPVFEPGGGGINVARAIAHLGGTATAIFPAGGATGEHRYRCWLTNRFQCRPSTPKTGPGKTFMFMLNPAVNSIAL